MGKKTKWVLCLTRTDVIVGTIGAVISSFFYVLGLLFYFCNSTVISFISFISALSVLVLLLVYFIIGEINLRIADKKNKPKEKIA